ncbi:uncharacterized protein G2W53_017981 [Senna tora]|uniref:Uncharacterized protein n=1 Tax=Senna tora TaxID=362788 RepID=A0A834TRV5_9FABA|nr:uncharacterized protein G2W53_017981 [Senna tora]
MAPLLPHIPPLDALTDEDLESIQEI